jgi:hypothetical protein
MIQQKVKHRRVARTHFSFPIIGAPSAADAARVLQFVDLMRAGVLFPPVRVVFRRDGAFIVQDGGTRAAASLRLGFSYIPAVANPQPWPNVPSWL